jgi:hypothetical protein
MRAAVVMGVLALALVGCGPIPVAEAERECLREARLAERPRGEIDIFSGSAGSGGSVTLEVSSDYVLGRDPETVFQNCVLQRSGELPRRPYRQF